MVAISFQHALILLATSLLYDVLWKLLPYEQQNRQCRQYIAGTQMKPEIWHKKSSYSAVAMVTNELSRTSKPCTRLLHCNMSHRMVLYSASPHLSMIGTTTHLLSTWSHWSHTVDAQCFVFCWQNSCAHKNGGFYYTYPFGLNYQMYFFFCRGSSVSIVSDYGLDDQGSIADRGRGLFF
jgi:hypothetical protein